jgi:hypothetical protein
VPPPEQFTENGAFLCISSVTSRAILAGISVQIIFGYFSLESLFAFKHFFPLRHELPAVTYLS